MSELLVKDKAIVIPGEELATGMDFLPSYGTYREGESIVAARLGLVNVDGQVIKLIPLSGRYMPKRGDTIIGKVIDVLMSGWRMEFNSAYSGMLPLKDATQEFIMKGADLTKYFEIDDWVVTKISNVTSQKLVDLNMRGPGLRKLTGGRIISVNPHKVPRIIGKQGSMVSMVKQATGCSIVVGQNGWVWIQGAIKSELVAVNAIRKIEDESHISGLTERMKTYLEKITGVKVEAKADAEMQQSEEGGERPQYQERSYGDRPQFERREGGYPPREGGYQERRNFPPREGGYNRGGGGYRGGGGTGGGFQRREFPPRRDFQPRQDSNNGEQ